MHEIVGNGLIFYPFYYYIFGYYLLVKLPLFERQRERLVRAIENYFDGCDLPNLPI